MDYRWRTGDTTQFCAHAHRANHGWRAKHPDCNATLRTAPRPTPRAPEPAPGAAAMREKIFSLFARPSPSQGTGLGLSWSYDTITKDHGGALSIERPEGRYTLFTIRLPLQPLPAGF